MQIWVPVLVGALVVAEEVVPVLVALAACRTRARSPYHARLFSAVADVNIRVYAWVVGVDTAFGHTTRNRNTDPVRVGLAVVVERQTAWAQVAAAVVAVAFAVA